MLNSAAKKGAYKGMPTVLTGSSIRSAIETQFNIIETQTGAFGKTPASMSSRVMNFDNSDIEGRRNLAAADFMKAQSGGDVSAMAEGLNAVRLGDGTCCIGILG